MAKLKIKEIQDEAVRIILRNPGGIRYSLLHQEIVGRHPETPPNSIHGAIWNLAETHSGEVHKPSRGLYQPVGAIDTPTRTLPKSLREDQFYQLFADWLKNDLEEVTSVVALGGSKLGKKWGTPDVLGVYKPLASDLVRFQPEVVSAEVKISPSEAITAFGQAAAYRLFSTKTYIVMPNTIPQDDLSRIESLCMLFGVGLSLFDLNPRRPNFQIRVRAQRFSADMFYVNELAERLRNQDAETFQKLFG